MKPHIFLSAVTFLAGADALHHMKRTINPRQQSSGSVPLVVSNGCGETIYPGIVTQSGTGPSSQGFELSPGANKSQTVSADWQGRVWGRTNCSFNSQGTAQSGAVACGTGDCNGAVNCQYTGAVPVTLAEFTLDGGSSQSFYDLSIVDGYNLPIAIVLIPNGHNTNLSPNTTNPSCVGSVGDLAAVGYNPYTSGLQNFLGTSSSDPLPFDQSVTANQVSMWCPWDLQSDPPKTPSNGVYPYPDTNIERPAFSPCQSACAKYNSDQYCCTGNYDSPNTCSTNYYSQAAKKVCPDAYSYAYDDQTSTFIIGSGSGFEVVFCPGGRSTTILKTKAGSSSSSSKRSSGSFRPAAGRTHPILDVLGGTSGQAMFAALVTVLLSLCPA